MNKKNIFNLLQFAGGTFPGGGFSQSWGLETYVERGRVTNIKTLEQFLSTYIDGVIAKSEGPLVRAAMEAFKLGDDENLSEIEELSVASKLTKESRESALRMGNAFMRISAAAVEDEQISEIYNRYKKSGITYPVAYGIVMSCLDVPFEEAFSAYVFNSVNAIVQSGVKLIPLGNSDSQAFIAMMQDKMEKAVDTASSISFEEIVTFCPGLDIAGMEHETLPVRLYMT